MKNPLEVVPTNPITGEPTTDQNPIVVNANTAIETTPDLEVMEGGVKFIADSPEKIAKLVEAHNKRQQKKIKEEQEEPCLVYVKKGYEVPPHPQRNLSVPYVLQVLGSEEAVQELLNTGVYTMAKGVTLPKELPKKATTHLIK